MFSYKRFAWNRHGIQPEATVGLVHPDLEKRPDLKPFIASACRLLREYGISPLDQSGGSAFDIAFSGDGGVLGLHRHRQTDACAYVGFNAGHVGHYTPLALSDLELRLQQILAGQFRTTQLPRIGFQSLVLSMEHDEWNNPMFLLLNRGGYPRTFNAINEIFFKSELRTMDIELRGSAGLQESYLRCDGIMFYTPQGATGWAYGYHGPRLTKHQFGILPIGTQDRRKPQKFDQTETLEITLKIPRTGKAWCYIDNLHHLIAEGEYRWTLGAYPVPFVQIIPDGVKIPPTKEIIRRKRALAG